MEEVQELFQMMAENRCAWSNDSRVYPKKHAGFLEIDNATNFGVQLAAFTTQLKLLENRLNTKQVLVCGL